MKFKKTKLLKVLSLTGAVGIVAATPIISTSCSLKDLTDLINKTLGNNEIKVNQSVTLNGSYDELFKNSDTNVSKLLTQNLSSLIGNFADIQKYFDGVEIKTDLGSLIKTSFLDQFEPVVETASSSIESILYSTKSSSLEITSINELKTKVSSSLKDILATSDSDKFKDIKEASVVQDSKVVYDANKGIFGVKVTATPNGTNSEQQAKQYLLEIPFSKANIKLTGFTVKIGAPKIDLLTIKDLTIVYSSGAHFGQSEYEFKRGPIVVPVSPSVDNILAGMGWVKDNAWNEDLMFKDANLFNAVVVDKKITSTPSKEAGKENNKYGITLTVQPKDGMLWENGSRVIKSIVISGISVQYKDAELKEEALQTFSLQLPKELFALAKTNPEVFSNDDDLLKIIKKFITNSQWIQNADITFKNKLSLEELHLEHKESPEVKKGDKTIVNFELKAIANDGHLFENGSKEKQFTFKVEFVNSGESLSNQQQ